MLALHSGLEKCISLHILAIVLLEHDVRHMTTEHIHAQNFYVGKKMTVYEVHLYTVPCMYR